MLLSVYRLDAAYTHSVCGLAEYYFAIIPVALYMIGHYNENSTKTMYIYYDEQMTNKEQD